MEESQNEREGGSTKSVAYSASSSSITSTSGPIAIPGSPARPSPSRQSSRDSLESLEEGDEGRLITLTMSVLLVDRGRRFFVGNRSIFFPETRRSRNPVRRSNSSPEMSANWKNPFLNKDKLILQQTDPPSNDFDMKLDAELKKHAKNVYAKDMRYEIVSRCSET